MGWATLKYKKGIVDAAGVALTSAMPFTPKYDEALDIINNWRACHSFPLNTFQNGLRHRARKFDPNSLIAQRIKRLSSIDAKLSRFPTMKLSQMQDIAGCRAILRSISEVDSVVSDYLNSEIKHTLYDQDDYIRNPKASGYRGIHLKYRYLSDKKETYNGLRIEIQLRSNLQHAWATAVETVGTFIRQALKSSQGEEDWLRFFSLMGTAIALRERCKPVPDTPTSSVTLKAEIKRYLKKLKVDDHLRAYGAALEIGERIGKNAHYFLLELDANAKSIKVTGYQSAQLHEASDDYLAAEKGLKSGSDAVLVSVESVESLRRAYPNYFLDTDVFLQAVKQAVK